jgi:hypothetical protein
LTQQQEHNKPEKQTEEKFSFPPGSSVPAIERNIHAPRRKIPPYYPTPTSPAYDPSKEPKISLATELLPERRSRRVQRCGCKRYPAINLVADWLDKMGVDWRNKENDDNWLQMEFSADWSQIVIKKRPPAEGREKPVYSDALDAMANVEVVLPVDSDAAAEAAER